MGKGKRDVLVLGASGMLGSMVLRYFSKRGQYDVVATGRSPSPPASLVELKSSYVGGVDAENFDSLVEVLADHRPAVIVNCIGVVKQKAEADDALRALPINATLPHRLARIGQLAGARLVHVSTDCVFSGKKGNYVESDVPDATDLYGRSKLLGEADYPNAITLRTSIIGPEIGRTHGLLEWFLRQEGSAPGYRRAIFSGVPTVELARVVHDFVIPAGELRGVYHLSAKAIDKYRLLKLFADAYNRPTTVIPDDSLVIDRSLDSSRFQSATGWRPVEWPSLVSAMRDFG